MILSILIPSLRTRSALLSILIQELENQIGDKDIEILVDRSDGTTGEKRNRLLEHAKGEYIAFIDDDDAVAHNYIDLIVAALETKPDCLSLKGTMTVNGKNPRTFIHSLEHKAYFEKAGVYYRPPNHLNVINRELIKDFKFPAKTFGEDTDWAMRVCKAGVLQTQVEIDSVLYYYQYKNKQWR